MTLKKFALAAAIVAAWMGPALAEDCGTAPVPPSMPTPSALAAKPVEAARAEVVDAYNQVKEYQAQLKPYRSCLIIQQKNDELAAAQARQKKDKVAIASAEDKATQDAKAYNDTVDSEEQVAQDFNTAHSAYCARDATAPETVCKK